MANKKLIATTVSCREKEIRRREEVVQGNPEESRNNLMKVDDDSPTHTRNSRNNNDDETKRMEDLRGKGGGRLKHCTADGDVPLCLRKIRKKATTTAAAKERRAKKRKAEAALWARQSIVSRIKKASGSEDISPRTIEEKDEHPKKQGSDFHYSSKKHEVNAFK